MHCKKVTPVFPPLAGMSLTKLSLAGEYFPARDGQNYNFFYSGGAVLYNQGHRTKPKFGKFKLDI